MILVHFFCYYISHKFEFNTQKGDVKGGKDTCQGDSGGAIFIRDNENGIENYIAVGLVSYGDKCGLPDKPGIYTRVSYFLNWINQNLAYSIKSMFLYINGNIKLV